MSVAEHRMVMEALRTKFAEDMPLTILERVMASVESVLAEYELIRTSVDETGEDMMVNAYLDAMSVEGRSEKTLERYGYIIGRMLKAVGVSTRNISQYHIRRYLSDEKARGVADSTIRGMCWVFSAYFGWLHRDGLIPKNPMGNIGKIRVPKVIRDTVSSVDFERLKDHCRTVRDRAIVCFLKATGCRVSEVVRLNRDDINYANLDVIVFGKGAKQRTVYFDTVTGMLLKEYMKERKDNNEALFIGCRGERLSAYGIRSMLGRTSKAAGIAHVHPHKLRRTEFTELARRGMPVEQIRMIAGHENISTTMGYVNVNQENVRNAYSRFA